MTRDAAATERLEIRAAIALICFSALLRVPMAFNAIVDSDEPQHLHVSWAWTKGFLQYRDAFDNHMPLFHAAMAPLVASIGETPRILWIARLAMIPLALGIVWGGWAIGHSLFDRRNALWGAVLLSFTPKFLQMTAQFRTDVLWALFSVLAVLALVRGAFLPERAFRAGLLLGGAAAVSLKTSLLLGAIATAALALLFVPKRGERFRWPDRTAVESTLAFLGAALILPGLSVAYFVWRGAFHEMAECVVFFNLIPGLAKEPWREAFAWAFPVSVPFLFWGARTIARRTEDEQLGRRRAFVFAVAGSYLTLFLSYSPVHTHQTWLPFYPLAAALLAPALLRLAERRSRFGRLGVASILAIACAGMAYICVEFPPWVDETVPARRLIATTLRLTGPDEPVLDTKGEAIFRRRVTPYVLEALTMEKLRRGILPDDLVDRVIASGPSAVAPDSQRFPTRTREFLIENFVPIGGVRVPGKILTAGALSDGALSFEVRMPADYVIVDRSGPVEGVLDGIPLARSRRLEAGRHLFRPYRFVPPLAIVWSRAIERGLSPILPGGDGARVR